MEELAEARGYLGRVKRNEVGPQDKGKAVSCFLRLLASLAASLSSPPPPPLPLDRAVVAAAVEVLVRWGISPCLSPGVGIPRDPGPPPTSHPDCNNDIAPPPPSLFACADALLAAALLSENPRASSDSPLACLILDRYLSDIMAAFLQIAYAPPPVEGDDERKRLCETKLREMVEKLPVAKMAEAAMILLNRKSPPKWLKSQVGAKLSQLVMRNGGVAAILRILLTGDGKGEVRVHEDVASHLAKVPRSICTTEEYYKSVCPQLPALFHLQLSPLAEPAAESRPSLQIIKNIHVTSSALACNLVVAEPTLAWKYLIEPMTSTIMTWVRSQTEHLQREEDPVDESELVQSLAQVQVLLTTGHKDHALVKELVFSHLRSALPWILKLHYHLTSHSLLLPSSSSSIDSRSAEKRKPIEARETDSGGTIGSLRKAIADIVISQATQPIEKSLPVLNDFLFELATLPLKWPQNEGEICNLIKSTKHLSTPDQYLTRLLCKAENWPLTVSVMGMLLSKAFALRKAIRKASNVETPPPVTLEFMNYMNTFDRINGNLGIKALEKDPLGALSLVKSLFNDESIFSDNDTLELVLHMVYSSLDGFHRNTKDLANERHGLSAEESTALRELMESLGKVCSNEAPAKLASMSCALIQTISEILSP